ncbi:16S rRNA (uracil(1498)-N(3))-methyltransferase [Eionea flava]
MHIPRIYIEQPLRANDTLLLDKSAMHHLVTVMRMKVGRSFILFNGEPVDGEYGEFSAVLAQVDKKSAQVSVGEFTVRHTEASLHIHLGACVIKNDRMDWLLQKATELGVAEITPLFSEYTDAKLSAERLEKKYLHWQKVVVHACEQSGRVKLPNINLPLKLSDWLPSLALSSCNIVLHPYASSGFCWNDMTTDSATEPTHVSLLVGPEGGLTDEEVEAACHHRFSAMTVGARILRAETAPLAAISLLMHHCGEF